MSHYPVSELIKTLHGVHQVEYWVGVPDTRLKPLLDGISGLVEIEYAPREDLAVAAAFGASLAGFRACVFMKDAGLGHCLDALLTTFRLAGLPLTLVVSTAEPTTKMPLHHQTWHDVLIKILEALAIPARTISDTARNDLSIFVGRSIARDEIHAILIDIRLT